MELTSFPSANNLTTYLPFLLVVTVIVTLLVSPGYAIDTLVLEYTLPARSVANARDAEATPGLATKTAKACLWDTP